MSSPYSPYGGGEPGGYPPPQQGGYQQQGYQQPGYQGYPPPQQGYGYPPQGGAPQQGGYLGGAPVDFQSAIKLQFENVMNFNGRASQSAFWWYALGIFAVNIVLEIFSIAIGSVGLSALFGLLMLVVLLSGLSVAVRRLHDTDKSGFLLLLDFIPFVGWIAVIVLLALPGTPGPNRFG